MLSKATIGRLPEYLNYLRRLSGNTELISATAIARELELGEVQVRKDLAAVSGKGKPKTGYSVTELEAAMEQALGIRSQSEAVIVGAGRLGMALLGFGELSQYGITVRCAFDKTAKRGNPQVRPMEELPDYCQLHQVEIGILTVPAEAAQAVANLFVQCGVKAIWCFAVCRLTVPEGVSVQYENLALSLAHLRSKTSDLNRTEEL